MIIFVYLGLESKSFLEKEQFAIADLLINCESLLLLLLSHYYYCYCVRRHIRGLKVMSSKMLVWV